MADFAATAGKTDDMTHAHAKIVSPARHENRMAARAYALVMRWLVRLAALITVAILVPDRLYPGQRYSQPQAVPV